MRNGQKPLVGQIAAVTLALILAAGCAPKNKPKPAAAPAQPVLDAGYQALETQQYNEAITKADEFLATTPHGPGSAEALYLKGRALEGKNAAGVDATEAADNLQAARTAYIDALQLNPKQPLRAYLHASLGNVCYFQDDYASALGQLNAAADELDNKDVKSWVLYRTALCQQRQGQFEQADKTFAKVQDDYPGTIPAQRSREKQGARSFYVQLATYASSQSADASIAELKQQGVNAIRVADTQGHALVRVGPMASYSQALHLKQRFAAKFPDALILP